MAHQSRPINPRMHYVVLTVTSSGCLELYLNPLEFGVLQTAVDTCNTVLSQISNLLILSRPTCHL